MHPAHITWSLNTRVVLSTTGILIVAGALLLGLTGTTSEEESFGSRFSGALFQSVTARTAGFNSVDISALPVPSIMVLILLMFIGGSPGGAAGGIKTTTLRVWLARVYARILQKDDVVLMNRRIPHEVVRRAALILAVTMLWNSVGIFLLVITEDCGDVFHLEDLIFEQISAFATVGLSTGVTPHLSAIGKIWIILSMFVGRLGPLTIALAVVHKRTQPLYAHPTERVMIG